MASNIFDRNGLVVTSRSAGRGQPLVLEFHGGFGIPTLNVESAAELVMKLRFWIEEQERPNDDGHLRAYCTPEMVKMREEAFSLCADNDCDLSGGYAHAGDCEVCSCGKRHALLECPEKASR